MKKRLLLLMATFTLACAAQAEPWKSDGQTWLSNDAEGLPVDFQIQGEYLGDSGKATQHGAQVIALGKGRFHAVIYPGGLPGAGWNGSERILLDGKLEGEKAVFVPAKGPKNYMDGNPEKFAAVRTFPPKGHEEWTGEIKEGEFHLKPASPGRPFTMKATSRKSPTLGAKPPEGATVLFDGSNKDHFEGGRVDETTGFLHTDARDIRSKAKFTYYKVHIEFMTPFRPEKRSQGRGNSGFFQSDGSEVQVLDSFGLEGLANEAGGIYKHSAPKVNMALPPLTWQTYDVEVAPKETDAEGNPKGTLITVRHNGVLIQEKVGGRDNPSGHIKMQGHGNPLQYRNIWIVERK